MLDLFLEHFGLVEVVLKIGARLSYLLLDLADSLNIRVQLFVVERRVHVFDLSGLF
jgi:hypothetical protein